MEILKANGLGSRALKPISAGGVGLPSASDHHRWTMLVSRANNSIWFNLQKLSGFEDVTFPPDTNEEVSKVERAPDNQMLNTFAVDVHRWFEICSQDPHNGAFLTAKPSGSTELSNHEMEVALRLRFGINQLPSGHHCNTHEYDIDAAGRHALLCQNWQGAVHRRHDLLRDVIFNQCSILDHEAEFKTDMPRGGTPILKAPQ